MVDMDEFEIGDIFTLNKPDKEFRNKFICATKEETMSIEGISRDVSNTRIEGTVLIEDLFESEFIWTGSDLTKKGPVFNGMVEYSRFFVLRLPKGKDIPKEIKHWYYTAFFMLPTSLVKKTGERIIDARKLPKSYSNCLSCILEKEASILTTEKIRTTDIDMTQFFGISRRCVPSIHSIKDIKSYAATRLLSTYKPNIVMHGSIPNIRNKRLYCKKCGATPNVNRVAKCLQVVVKRKKTTAKFLCRNCEEPYTIKMDKRGRSVLVNEAKKTQMAAEGTADVADEDILW